MRDLRSHNEMLNSNKHRLEEESGATGTKKL